VPEEVTEEEQHLHDLKEEEAERLADLAGRQTALAKPAPEIDEEPGLD
jgi:hypothetical protein